MNDELERELKDAGFPIHPWSGNIEACYCGSERSGECIPILSELIEACGEEFNMVNVTSNPEPSKKWHALAGYVMVLEAALTNTHAYGATPQEAVARLWLALNKK